AAPEALRIRAPGIVRRMAVVGKPESSASLAARCAASWIDRAAAEALGLDTMSDKMAGRLPHRSDSFVRSDRECQRNNYNYRMEVVPFVLPWSSKCQET